MKKARIFLLFLAAAFFGTAMAQDRTVSGTVTSVEDGAPIVGAYIVIKGTTTGSVTDIDGKYTITLPSGPQPLVFSFVGMKSVERPVRT